MSSNLLNVTFRKDGHLTQKFRSPLDIKYEDLVELIKGSKDFVSKDEDFYLVYDGKSFSGSLCDLVIDNLEADIIIDVVSKTVFHALPSGYCKSVLTGHAEAVLCCKFDPSGALLASGSGDGMLIVWDPMSGTPIKKFKCSSQWVQCLAWSGDGRYLAVGAVNGMLHLLEIEKWSFVQLKTNSSKPITCLAWNHDNLLLAVSSDDGVVRLFELPSLFAKLAFSAHDSTVTSLQFTPEGYLYSTSRDCFIKYWDPSFSLVHRLKPHSHWVNYMLSSKQHLYTCSDDGTVCMVSKDLSRSVKLTGHQGPVIHLALNEQKGILASASFDKSIKLWNADTGKYIKSLRGHANAVYMICWSLDGRYLASISKDSTVKIWDCDGQLTKELAGHKDEVYCLDWSSQGCLTSGCKDRTLRIWH